MSVGSSCHPLSLVSNIISNSNRFAKWAAILKEKVACVEGDLGPIEKEGTTISKAHLNNNLQLIEGRPSKGKACSRGGPTGTGPKSFFDKQTHLVGPRERNSCCNTYNLLEVIGDDGETLPKNLNSSLYASMPFSAQEGSWVAVMPEVCLCHPLLRKC